MDLCKAIFQKKVSIGAYPKNTKLTFGAIKYEKLMAYSI